MGHQKRKEKKRNEKSIDLILLNNRKSALKVEY